MSRFDAPGKTCTTNDQQLIKTATTGSKWCPCTDARLAPSQIHHSIRQQKAMQDQLIHSSRTTASLAGSSGNEEFTSDWAWQMHRAVFSLVPICHSHPSTAMAVKTIILLTGYVTDLPSGGLKTEFFQQFFCKWLFVIIF